jgi:hypothetical protein
MTPSSTARRSMRRSRDLAGGGFLAQQRNAVLVGGTDHDSLCSPRDVIGM